MTQRDKWKKRDCVERYRSFCDITLWELKKNKVKLEDLEKDLNLAFIIQMPKSWTEKKKKEHDGKPHLQKPDIDNLLKAFLDAIFKDDSHIHKVKMQKVWGRQGRILIL